MTPLSHYITIPESISVKKKKSSQVTFIYIALLQIVSKQLHSDNMKIIQYRSIILLHFK